MCRSVRAITQAQEMKKDAKRRARKGERGEGKEWWQALAVARKTRKEMRDAAPVLEAKRGEQA